MTIFYSSVGINRNKENKNKMLQIYGAQNIHISCNNLGSKSLDIEILLACAVISFFKTVMTLIMMTVWNNAHLLWSNPGVIPEIYYNS